MKRPPNIVWHYCVAPMRRALVDIRYRAKHLLSLCLMLTVLAACTAYPPHGTGGFAEHQRSTHHEAYPRTFTASYGGNTKQQRWHNRNIGLVACVDERLAELRQHGANQYFPAQFWLIEQQRNRTLRHFAGGMGWDGERETDALLEMMEKLSERVKQHELLKVKLENHPEKISCKS